MQYESRPTLRVVIRTCLSAALILGLGSAAAWAHDFWLVPNAFSFASGGVIEVRGQTSSRFPTSEAAVAPDRVADARILTNDGSSRIRELAVSGTSLVLRHTPTGAGQRVVAVTLHPRSVRESAAGFRRYLELEGAPLALARVDREGLLSGRDSVTRRYAKYAKTVVEMGSGGARAFGRVAGHPLEFIPLTDPSASSLGETLRFRLLYRGQPLRDAQIHASYVPAPGERVTLTAAAVEPDIHAATDADGIVELRLRGAGMWNVRTLHVVESDPGSGADWDTHWATFVFHVDAGGGARTQSGDSAAVAAAVDAYHRALSTGDSTAALALLTSDAVILESGGMESRAEYRSHHLPSDIAFASAVPSVRGPVRVVVNGDVAWASSTSTSQGEFRGRAVNSAGAELMVLIRTPDGWKITAIHWSSRARRQ